MITKEQLDELERKAKAATPGPWRQYEPLVLSATDGGMDIADCALGSEPEDIEEWPAALADAAHIAANSPDVTLQLVAIARAALAWSEADRRLANAGYSIGDYDDAKDKVDAMLDGIRVALRGGT